MGGNFLKKFPPILNSLIFIFSSSYYILQFKSGNLNFRSFVPPAGLEPATFCLKGSYSLPTGRQTCLPAGRYQLSYELVIKILLKFPYRNQIYKIFLFFAPLNDRRIFLDKLIRMAVYVLLN